MGSGSRNELVYCDEIREISKQSLLTITPTMLSLLEGVKMPFALTFTVPTSLPFGVSGLALLFSTSAAGTAEAENVAGKEEEEVAPELTPAVRIGAAGFPNAP